MSDRQAFLDAIEADPDSQALREVYAAWLLENDMPEEADRQRKFLAARAWLTEFAARCGDTATNYDEHCQGHLARYAAERAGVTYTGPEPPELAWRPISYDDVVDAGLRYVDRGDWFFQIGEETARDLCVGEVATLYWQNWSIVTGRSVPAGDPNYPDTEIHSPFSCSC